MKLALLGAESWSRDFLRSLATESFQCPHQGAPLSQWGAGSSRPKGSRPELRGTWMAREQETTGIFWNKRRSQWTKGKTFSPWGQSGSGVGCPEKLCSLHSWRFSSPNWIKPWATTSNLRTDPALPVELNWRPPDVTSNLNYSMSIWLAIPPWKALIIPLPLLYCTWTQHALGNWDKI